MTFAEMAEPYIARRWKVFPVNRDKRPMVEKGYQSATCDPEIIASWSRRFPTANIAIATGAMSGITVLDVDGPKGEESFCALKKRVTIPDAPTVRSARGWHLYFRHAGRTPSSAGRIGPGIDVRANGGSITAPPSVHATGHIYEWLEPLGERLPSLPLALFPDLYRPQVVITRRPIDLIDLRELADQVAGAPEGERNHRLNSAAFQAGLLVGEGLVSYGEAHDALFQAARAAGLDAVEIRSTLRSGLRAGQAR